MLRPSNYRPPELKSARELSLMRESGTLVVQALDICRRMAKPGTKTIDIDREVEAFYAKHGATPLFKGYPGKVPFPAVTCLSINEQVVHGIPGQRELKDGQGQPESECHGAVSVSLRGGREPEASVTDRAETVTDASGS